MGSIRGDKLRVIALIEPIYDNLKSLRDKAKFIMNVNSFIMMLERHKRITVYDLIAQTLKQINPNNPEHLESVCYIALSMLEKVRQMNTTLYIHSKEAEDHLKSVMINCLKANRHLVADLVSQESTSPRYVAEPLRSHIIMFCLLAKIKFEIRSPVVDRMDKLLPEMNDLAFTYCFSAMDPSRHMQALTAELKARLKPEKCFGIVYLNKIMGSFFFKTKAAIHLLHPETRVAMKFVSDITMDQLLNLPTVINPNFTEQVEDLKENIKPLLTVIERYFLNLQKKNEISIVKSSYLTTTFSFDVFSKNDYRRQGYAFTLQKPSKFYLSSEELLFFYRYSNFLNCFSVDFWKKFEGMLFELDKAGIFDGSCDGKDGMPPLGIVTNYAKTCSKQNVRNSQVWEILEKVHSRSHPRRLSKVSRDRFSLHSRP